MSAPHGTDPREPKRVLLAGSVDDEHNRLLKIFAAYRDAGYQVSFVGMDRFNRRPRHYQAGGLSCEYLTGGWRRSNWRLLIGYPVWIVKLFLYMLRARVDLVHSFELDSALPVALASLFRRIPFLYDVQDNYDLRHRWGFPLTQLIRAVDGWVLSRAHAIIVPDRNRIVGPFRPHAQKIAILPNCPPHVAPRADLPPRSRFTVLAMGELSERRGIGLLLDAAAEQPELRLLMAGIFPDPKLEARALGMPQVEFRGWLPWDAAIALGYEADLVFAFYDPSFAVNLLANAQKWFDAMMTGTPVLSNREINNAEWIEREDFGYICRYGDVDALRELLRHMMQHPEEIRRKGQRARHLYETQYNWPLMERKLLALAQSALSGEAAARTAHVHPRVLMVVENYLPGYKGGGPGRTVSNTVEELGRKFDFLVLCRDREVGETRPYPGITSDDWSQIGRASVFHASTLPPRKFLRLVRESGTELIFLNSFFGPWTVQALLLRRLGLLNHVPVVLAPRGSLAEGALRHKRFKKTLYLALTKLMGFYSDLDWQASSVLEREEIEREMGKGARVYIAPDIAAITAREQVNQRAKQRGRARFVHLSRVVPKKNLRFALEALRGVRGEVSFDIYGPREDERYWRECERAIAALPANLQVRYRGSVAYEQVPDTLAAYDFFVFPTHGENFGHVTLEAMSEGCPVVLSDQTPWRNLAEKKVGWDIPLDQADAWRAVLQQCVDMGAQEYAEWSHNARQFAIEWVGSPFAREQTDGLLESVLTASRA